MNIIDTVRAKHAITIFATPRGLFLHIHFEDHDGNPDIECKFTNFENLEAFLKMVESGDIGAVSVEAIKVGSGHSITST